MNSNHIFTEILYGYKRSRRNVIFRIFVLLGIVGITLYVFTPLSGLGSARNLEQLFRGPAMDWFSRSLSSSIPFKCAYLFNILQLLFSVVLVSNDSRRFRLDSTVALSVHAQGNSEITTGNVIGKILAFTLVNVSFLTFCALLNLLFYPEVFNVGYYFFYWLTQNLPTTVFCICLSTYVMRLTGNQGLGMLFLAVILGVLTLPGSVWLNGLFDPLATGIPNMFSDFTGHVNPGNYLLQRVFILFSGVGLAILSVIHYPRIPNNSRAPFRLVCVALLPLLFAGSLAVVYTCGIQTVSKKREAFRDAYAKYDREKPLKIAANYLQLKETENGGISVTSRMTVENRDSVVLPLVLYLNPGLVVSSIIVDGKTVSFQREQQVILVDETVSSGKTSEVVVKYEGKIDNSFCFLDTPEEKYASPEVNTIGIYRFGYSPAFCEKEYKLLPPECVWYPVSVPLYHSQGFREKMFTHYTLEVEHDPSLVAISQGKADRETAGKTKFRFDHNMPGISLCIGNYKRREVLVSNDLTGMRISAGVTIEFVEDDHPVRVELFYLPEHEFILDSYDAITELDFLEVIKSVKNKVDFYSSYSNYSYKRLENKIAYDPTLQYPYSWLTLVETPCNFHVFAGRSLQGGECVQGGMVFLPEKSYSVDEYFYFSDDKAEEACMRLSQKLKLFSEGSCDLRSSCVGNTGFLYSDECPLLNDALKWFLNSLSHAILVDGVAEYLVVDYLKNHSLEDALLDDSLSPELLNNIIYKKCDELLALLNVRIGNKKFMEAYHDFLGRHLFEEADMEDFSRELFTRFGVGLDTIVEKWYRSNRLPIFQVVGHGISVGEYGAEKIYDFKVFNRGEAPGVIMLSDQKTGWIIPPGEGRSIRKRVKGATNFFVSTILSLNLPSGIELPQEKGDVDTDTTEWFLPFDGSLFPTNEDEIIVDNEDPGFTIQETKKFSVASLFGQVETRAKCYRVPPANHWGRILRWDCQGSPVRGAYFKVAGKGNQKVQWETNLPREGKYEVFCYLPCDAGRMYYAAAARTYYYTVFDGEEEHEVVLSLDKDTWEWVSLGVFDFRGIARVTLSDRGRECTPENEDFGPQVMAADAIKWVKIRE
ncbi:hypothetical protein [Butyricimonas synergistica]|uniref:golvesin C-terminal-like domain-containing protein n=1 Tax=Butyricimonas synergistica TaxID=544644 RepID=UPI00035D74CD|nr:hypothetical protein [Butyricimonas synergistica]